MDFGHHTSGWYGADELQPFEEKESMEEKKINQMSLANCDLDEIEIVLGDKFELKIKEGKYYAVKKKLHYPKTYEECCEVLNYESNEDEINCYQGHLIESFVKLFTCRNAYWKIAGEQMGLGKSWEPDYNEESYEQGSSIKYVIYYTGIYITKERKCTPSYILAFPTEEMRNAFYENFKEFIEICKELL